MNVSIDRDGCIGCGLCVTVCPEVFRMADDGISEVYADPTAESIDSVRNAAEECPVEVISID